MCCINSYLIVLGVLLNLCFWYQNDSSAIIIITGNAFLVMLDVIDFLWLLSYRHHGSLFRSNKAWMLEGGWKQLLFLKTGYIPSLSNISIFHFCLSMLLQTMASLFISSDTGASYGLKIDWICRLLWITYRWRSLSIHLESDLCHYLWSSCIVSWFNSFDIHEQLLYSSVLVLWSCIVGTGCSIWLHCLLPKTKGSCVSWWGELWWSKFRAGNAGNESPRSYTRGGKAC